MTLILKQVEDLGLTAQEASEAALDFMEARLRFTLRSTKLVKTALELRHVITIVDYVETGLKLAQCQSRVKTSLEWKHVIDNVDNIRVGGEGGLIAVDR